MSVWFFVSFLSLLISRVAAAGLQDVEHVVLFMQENRAFDHYYGTMAGVRGFKDPNVLKHADGKPIWYQSLSNGSTTLPFNLTPHESYRRSTQCLIAGSNDWTPNHRAWNNGKVDQWIQANTPWSWGHLTRNDIPTHFDIVEGWTVADMYAEAVIGPTGPNRVAWISGTINVPGSPPGDPLKYGGPYIENWQNEGCQNYSGVLSSCYPLKWKSVPEYLEDKNVSWFLYEEKDNYADNPLPWFKSFQDDGQNGPLQQKGMANVGLQRFFDDAKNGTLPQVSYVFAPMELSEHPPWNPSAGAWLQKKVVDAVTKSPLYNKTVLIVSYDETGGFGDHVPPFISPNGTTGEWFFNPEEYSEYVPSGPGFRVPLYVISPWTRGGKVYTTPADHNSQIKFLEKWAEAALNKNITTSEMNPWRRQVMTDLLDIFDWEHPDYSLPNISSEGVPSSFKKAMNNQDYCRSEVFPVMPDGRAPVPWGELNETIALHTEEGHKRVVGQLTEGRYLVFKGRNTSQCLTAGNSTHDDVLLLSGCSDNYKSKSQRFVVDQQGDAFSEHFKLRSVEAGYLKQNLQFNSTSSSFGDVFTIKFSSSKGYSFNSTEGLFNHTAAYDIFSVTFND